MRSRGYVCIAEEPVILYWDIVPLLPTTKSPELTLHHVAIVASEADGRRYALYRHAWQPSELGEDKGNNSETKAPFSPGEAILCYFGQVLVVNEEGTLFRIWLDQESKAKKR
jgi:hypothetical protein